MGIGISMYHISRSGAVRTAFKEKVSVRQRSQRTFIMAAIIICLWLMWSAWQGEARLLEEEKQLKAGNRIRAVTPQPLSPSDFSLEPVFYNALSANPSPSPSTTASQLLIWFPAPRAQSRVMVHPAPTLIHIAYSSLSLSLSICFPKRNCRTSKLIQDKKSQMCLRMLREPRRT